MEGHINGQKDKDELMNEWIEERETLKSGLFSLKFKA